MNPVVNGRFISNRCAADNCEGLLQQVAPTRWECDGLVDPENSQQELQCCHVDVVDGELFK